jgi:hypothetical protein
VAPVGVTFAESALLLLIAAVLGALLTGVLAPIVVLRVNRARNREQKVFEEELSRDTAVVSAQAELLKELAAALWDFQAKLLAVSYAGAYVPEQLDEAWKAYNAESFALLARISAVLSVAGTLFSAETTERLWRFYTDWLNEELDHPLSDMATARAAREKWLAWHNPHHRAAEERTAALLAAVADDAGLSVAHRRPSHKPR